MSIQQVTQDPVPFLILLGRIGLTVWPVAAVQKQMTSMANLLTEREDQILRLLTEDRSNKEIAASLGIARKTVEFVKIFVS